MGRRDDEWRTGPLSRRPQPFRLSLKHLLLAGLLIVAILVAVRWQAALTSLGAFLVDSQPRQPADLVLVLGGDFWGPRVLVGAELARQGYAPLALFSGPPYHGNAQDYARPEGELAIEFLVQKGYPKELFQFVATDADSTVTEAKALREELARRHVARVLLVTSNYHSRRATIVMTLFCPGVKFISVPAPDSHYHIVNWWSDDSSRRLFFSEWTKILGSVFMEYPRDLVSRIF
jgi:uncharacterized SAM-binding protein YcdF (DUF218 family)